MKLKIIANGKPHGTQVIDDATGEEVSGVLYAKIHLDAKKDGVPLVELGLTDVAVEIVAEDVRESLAGHFGECKPSIHNIENLGRTVAWK